MSIGFADQRQSISLYALILVSFAFLVGAGSNRAPKIIEAQGFRLVDDSGKTRGMWSVENDAAVFVAIGTDGQESFRISCKEGGEAVWSNKAGVPQVMISSKPGNGPDIRLFGDDGRPRIVIGSLAEESAISLGSIDPASPRIRISTSSKNPSGMTIWGPGGSVIWKQMTPVDKRDH